MHVSHLESALDGTRYEAGRIQTVHEGRPLWVRYDLDAVGAAASVATWRSRPDGMWRYRELLPHTAAPVALGETATPLIDCPSLAERFGVRRLTIKDESRLPTGSFKARGMALAVTMAREFGIETVALPSAGNAGGAAAAYAARAGLECVVAMPADTPVVNRVEAALFGAEVELVDGLITDCGARIAEGVREHGWFDLSTLKEPYRLEGKKTMGLELADQLEWDLPAAILYPTGGGTGLIGMAKAFDELAALGYLRNPTHRPRLYACQSDGCAPLPAAFASGARFAEPPANPHTVASGLRVPRAVGDFMILDAVRATGGSALAAPEEGITSWMRTVAGATGVSVCPETAVCFGVLAEVCANGGLGPDDHVVVFNTGAAQKYVEVLTGL